METYYEMETYLSGRIHTDKNKKPINIIGFFIALKINYFNPFLISFKAQS